MNQACPLTHAKTATRCRRRIASWLPTFWSTSSRHTTITTQFLWPMSKRSTRNICRVASSPTFPWRFPCHCSPSTPAPKSVLGSGLQRCCGTNRAGLLRRLLMDCFYIYELRFLIKYATFFPYTHTLTLNSRYSIDSVGSHYVRILDSEDAERRW